MENELICLDTSILIEYFRKGNKENSFFYQLAQSYQSFAVSEITEFEIYSGSKEDQQVFWDAFFNDLTILPLDSSVNKEAVLIFKSLKAKRKLIDLPDLFIGATASVHNLKLATLNEKHFSRINNLKLITPTKETD